MRQYSENMTTLSMEIDANYVFWGECTEPIYAGAVPKVIGTYTCLPSSTLGFKI